MCAPERVTVPAWPAQDGRVAFTCICCEELVEVLVEGCEPGMVADVACDNRECRSVNRVQVRKAMFS